jgi:hypothetical protein
MDGNCEMCGLQNCGCEAYRLNIVANAKDDEIAKLKAEREITKERVHEIGALIYTKIDGTGRLTIACDAMAEKILVALQETSDE